MRGTLAWLSGLWAGIAIGAAVACPAREVSVPFSLLLTVIFGAAAAWRRQ